MTRKIVIGLCGALLIAAMALAAAAHGPGHGAHGGDMGDAMVEHIASYLKLDATQKAAATQLMNDMHAKAEPLMEQQHQQWDDVEALVEAGNPDATDVGNKVIAAYATRAQLKALHEDFKTKFLALLNDEQKTKALEMEQKMHGGDHGPGFGHGPDH